MEMAAATDNCGEVVITVEEVTTAGLCWRLRNHSYVPATDDCGNATSATQTITIIVLQLQSSLLSQLIIQQSVLTNTQWKWLLLLITVVKL